MQYACDKIILKVWLNCVCLNSLLTLYQIIIHLAEDLVATVNIFTSTSISYIV